MGAFNVRTGADAANAARTAPAADENAVRARIGQSLDRRASESLDRRRRSSANEARPLCPFKPNAIASRATRTLEARAIGR